MTALLNKKVFQLNAIHLLDDRRMVHIVNMSGGGRGPCIAGSKLYKFERVGGGGREGCGWGLDWSLSGKGILYEGSPPEQPERQTDTT